MPLERMAFGLETEHQIYVGSAAATPDAQTRRELNIKATRALLEVVHSSPAVMGPVWALLRSQRPSLRDVAWLRNGARFYEDIHGTPEYSTPECITPDDLVAADMADMEIVAAAVPEAQRRIGLPIALYRNNTDGRGHSRGCHENYAVSPPLFNRITGGAASGMAPRILSTWFCIRQLLTGAGKAGAELADAVPFQLSQRPDFIRAFRSMDTIQNRPIIEQRDEPHADGNAVARLHVICGDTNMCPWSTYLKTGLTGLLLMAMDDGWLARRLLPVFTEQCTHWFRVISRDLEFKWSYPVLLIKADAESRRTQMGVRDMLRMYTEAIAEYAAQRSFPTEREKVAWKAVPGRAAHCVERISPDRWRELDGYLDWATKRLLLEDWLARAGRSWKALQDPDGDAWRRKARVRADLAYPFLNADRGIFFKMRGEGRIQPIVKPGDAVRAVSEPPPQSRSWQRTALVERYGRWLAASGVDWERVRFIQDGTVVTITLTRPWEASPALFRELLSRAATPLRLAALTATQPVPGTLVETAVQEKGA